MDLLNKIYEQYFEKEQLQGKIIMFSTTINVN